MAVLPNVPTSFVPHQTKSTRTKSVVPNVSGVFSVLAYGVLVIVLIGSVGLFFYARLLTATKAARVEELAHAEASIDPLTVRDLARLSHRLSAGQGLLDQHVAFSNFFFVIEKLIPQNVRFTGLHVLTDSAGTTKVRGNGVAKSFNALALASESFSADNNVRDALFSHITVDPKTGTVGFDFVATLDTSLIIYTPTDTGNEFTSPPIEQPSL